MPVDTGRGPNCAAPVRKTPLTTTGPHRIILDTSVLVAEDADLLDLACQISSVTHAELHFGVHAAPTTMRALTASPVDIEASAGPVARRKRPCACPPWQFRLNARTVPSKMPCAVVESPTMHSGH
jgi:hypothetical protein